MDNGVIVEEIAQIKSQLDRSHDMDPDHLPKPLRELRTYIFQVHASYEKSLEMLIWRDYLSSAVAYDSLEVLFEKLSFYDKLKIVRSVNENFPYGRTEKLNTLRNAFAHKKGETLRGLYRDDLKRLEVFRLLAQSEDVLNEFWRKQA